MMHSNETSFITQNGTKCCEDVLLRACPKNLKSASGCTQILRFALDDNMFDG